ncbi:hypothetical protein V2H07_01175 [Streptococcus agalactiae]|nr:hypothetical protein [Streptococcus agalactiae]MEE3765781.1 hypothetical protein [Streptococcus agalactiae]
MTLINDIKDAIKEYEDHYSAGSADTCIEEIKKLIILSEVEE